MTFEEPPWLKATEDAPREPNRAAFTSRFLVLGRVDLNRADHHITCRIELDRRGHSFTGEATELDTEPGRVRAAAKATLRAAENASTGAHLALEGVLITEFFGRRYVVVSVEAAAARQFIRLAHVVAIDRSVEEAACLATLGAVERWLAV